MTSFSKIVVESGAAAGIDDEGEIWILAGQQNSNFNLNLPPTSKHDPTGFREITRPVQTNFMRKLGLKAIDIRIGRTNMIVQAQDKDGNRRVVFLKGGGIQLSEED